jgi:hypothetical protein
MSVTRDMAATWRRPGRVAARHLERGASEPRLLAFVMGGSLLMFVAQWPRLARESHLSGTPMGEIIGGEIMRLIFLLPLFLYLIALLSHWVMRGLKGQGTAFAARLALFWAFLASGPLLLLVGLVSGFVGPGMQLEMTKLIYWLVFLWFWSAGLRALYFPKQEPA